MNKLDMAGIISNTRKPNIVQFVFELEDDIDPDVMAHALSRTIKRYPYFAFRIVRTDAGFDKVENEAPIPVLDTVGEIVLGSAAVNYHWVAVGCVGNRLKLVMHHSMADARSAMRFYKTLLYCYVSERYGVELDPTGIILPESAIAPDEDEKVVTPVGDADGSSRQTAQDSFEIPEPIGDELNNFYYALTMPEEEFVGFSKANDASPAAMMLVLMAKTFQTLHPDMDKDVVAALPADVREAIGCARSRHTNAYPVFIRLSPEVIGQGYDLLGAMTRAQIIAQTDERNLRFVHNTSVGYMARIRKAASADERRLLSVQMYATLVGNPTYTVSYVGSSEWGALAPYVARAYTFAFRGKMMLEINTAGGRFCVCWMQSFAGDAYAQTFRSLLAEQGIDCDVEGPFDLPWPRCEL